MAVGKRENTYAAVEGREALLTAQVPELCRRAGAGSNGAEAKPRKGGGARACRSN